MNQYQRKELIEQIKLLFIDFDSFDIKKLIGSDRLGKFDGFQSKESDFHGIEKLVSVVKNLNLEVLPITLLQKIKENLQQVNITYNNIQNFSFKDKDSEALKSFLNQEIEKVYTELNELVVKCSLFRYSETDSLESKIKSKLSLIEIATNEAKESLRQIFDMQSSAEKATKEIGVSRHSEEFNKLADSFNNSSRVWLFFLALSLIAAGAFVIYFPALLNKHFQGSFYMPTVKDINVQERIINFKFLSATLFKVSMIAILFYIITVCKNNYYVAKHNKIIYDHKAASLETFKTFTTSTTDEKTKDAILLEATKTIFDHQRTGYLKNEPESNENTFIEVIKNIKK